MKIWKDSWLARESFSSHDETERMVWAGWLAGPHLNLGAPSSFGCPIFATVSSSLRWAIAQRRDPLSSRTPHQSVANPKPEGHALGVPTTTAAKRPPLSRSPEQRRRRSDPGRPPDGRLFAMPQAPSDLLNEKLASV